MYITLSSSIALENSSFEGNRAENKGGTIYVKDRGEDFGLSSTHVTLKNKCIFYNNSAIEGSVTYILEAVLSDLGSVYSSNNARHNGGVTTLCGGIICVRESKFVLNSAESSGGVLFTTDYIRNSTISYSSKTLFSQ